jgi:(1->4)-alpha-D-glucan 1-alpha-D-glucosylmutase
LPSVNPTTSPLQRLCGHHGIATDYLDVWGQRQEVEDESLVGLLAAFGVDATSPASTQRAWEEAQAAEWQSPLPPVCAVPSDSTPWTLAIRVPDAAEELRWRITLEDGGMLEGAASLNAKAPSNERSK